MNEFELINQLFKPLVKKSFISQDLCDDVAKISLKDGEQLIVSKDIICENVHFYRNDGGYKIASKLLRSNLSDIASSGAKPAFYMLGFSKINDDNFIKDFVRGLKDTQNIYDLSLIGGDTISLKRQSDPLFFSITIFGIMKKGQNLSRQNALENDLIFVSGSIGDAFLGLNLVQNSDYINKFHFNENEKEYLLNRHYFPTPQIALGQELIKTNLSKCAIDISDGLIADINHICQSSNLSCEIYLNKIPTFFTKKLDYSFSKDLINKGDDYELAFSANKDDFDKIMSLQDSLKIKISCIGQFNKNKSKNRVELFLDNSKKQIINFSNLGYEH